MKRRRCCSGKAVIYWSVEMLEDTKSEVYEHPVIEAIVNFIPESGLSEVNGRLVDVFLEIGEKDIEIEDDELEE